MVATEDPSSAEIEEVSFAVMEDVSSVGAENMSLFATDDITTSWRFGLVDRGLTYPTMAAVNKGATPIRRGFTLCGSG